MKIQINSLAALERLIGGDTELEIEIRNSVIQAFSKKHLKDVANTETFKATERDVRKIIQELFIDNLSTSWNSPKLKTEYYKILKENIKAEVSKVVEDLIYKVTTEDIDYEKTRLAIVNRLQEKADWIEHELTNNVLESKLNKMVDKRLKDKLGL